MSRLGNRLDALERSHPQHLPASVARWLGMEPHPDAPEHYEGPDVPLSPEARAWLGLHDE